FQAISAELIQVQRPPFLAGWRLLFGRRRRGGDTGATPQAHRTQVDPQEQGDLTQLYALAGQLREVHARLVQRQRYRNILDVWLYLHVPLSIALVLAVTVHVIAALYYSPAKVILWRTF